MASKIFLLLGVLAVVLLISSEAAARDLSQTSSTAELENKGTKTNVEDGKYGGYPGGGGYSRGYGGYPGGGYRGGYPGRGGGYGGCRYGCCYRGYSGSCRRCCGYAGEKAQVEDKPQN